MLLLTYIVYLITRNCPVSMLNATGLIQKHIHTYFDVLWTSWLPARKYHFFPCHHGPSSVNLMHHSLNAKACTPFRRCYRSDVSQSLLFQVTKTYQCPPNILHITSYTYRFPCTICNIGGPGGHLIFHSVSGNHELSSVYIQLIIL